MIDVLIISNYWHFEYEKPSSRYLTIANLVADDKNMTAEVITSSFYHANKTHRDLNNEKLNSFKYKVTLINEPGYSKNITLKRIFSHKRFASGVISYLKNRKKPDVIYLFMPPLELAEKVSKYAKNNNIRLIIDVLDLWPEAYNMIFPFKAFNNFLFKPVELQANKAYSAADEIVAVSKTYAERALKVNKKCKEGHPIFIGTDLDVFDRYAKENSNKIIKANQETWIAYMGEFDASYGLKGIIDAVSSAQAKLNSNIRLIVMGEEQYRSKIENYAEFKNVKVDFLGEITYKEKVKILCKCDFAINDNSNIKELDLDKIIIYTAAGLPVINIQNDDITQQLFSKHDAGFNCLPEDSNGICSAIIRLTEDIERRDQMQINSRKLFECKFKKAPAIDDDNVVLVFSGTLGHSSDVKSIIDAVSILKEKGYANIKLLVMGDGPFRSKYEKYANECNINCEFTGRLPYEKMVGRLVECDIALNPVSKNAVQSIINKQADYLSAGLAIYNAQQVPEFGDLLTKYHAGLSFKVSDQKEMAHAVEYLLSDCFIRGIYGRNSRYIAERYFDRKNIYPKIIDLIKGRGNFCD